MCRFRPMATVSVRPTAEVRGLRENCSIAVARDHGTSPEATQSKERKSVSLRTHIVLMASYNQWMNAKLYEAAGRLPLGELAADRNAFFGSLLGTLNHIVVADTIWLKRFATHPAAHAALDPVRKLTLPGSLDQILFAEFAELSNHRKFLDKVICVWTESLTDADLAHVLQYANTKGVVGHRRFSSLVFHFFNHQTHHRGQATTLLHQAGQDVGVTDLLALIPNESDA